MNKCDGCKHKDNCICVPYGCECFEIDIEEHDKQIRTEVIEEAIHKLDNCAAIYHEDYIDGIHFAIGVLEVLKENRNEDSNRNT